MRRYALPVACMIGGTLCLIGSIVYGGETLGQRWTAEVTRASAEQGVPMPKLYGFHAADVPWPIGPRTLAFVLPCKPTGPCEPAIGLIVERASHADLTCAARHEVGHIKLGHLYGAQTTGGLARQHEELAFWMDAKYGDAYRSCRLED